MDFDKWTSENLKKECKKKGKKNYSNLKKDQLYRYCVQEEDLDNILKSRETPSRGRSSKRTQSPRRRSRSRSKSPKRSTRTPKKMMFELPNVEFERELKRGTSSRVLPVPGRLSSMQRSKSSRQLKSTAEEFPEFKPRVRRPLKIPVKRTMPRRASETPPLRLLPERLISDEKLKEEKMWMGCANSEENAEKCISKLSEKYPSIFKKLCTPILPGVDVGAFVVEEKKGENVVVGVATTEGEVIPIDKPIPEAIVEKVLEASIPPPPPPPPPMFGIPPPPPPPPPAFNIPVVKVEAKAKESLDKNLSAKKESGEAISRDDLLAQISKGVQLKKASERVLEEKIETEEKEENPLLKELKARMASGQKLNVISEEKRREDEENKRKRLEELNVGQPAFLQSIGKGRPQLRKAETKTSFSVDCGSEAEWNPSQMRCKCKNPSLNYLRGEKICRNCNNEFASKYNVSKEYCEASVEGGSTWSNVLRKYIPSDDYEFDCPDQNQVYDPEQNTCVNASCDEGYLFDYKLKRCIPRDCGIDMVYDRNLKKCIPVIRSSNVNAKIVSQLVKSEL